VKLQLGAVAKRLEPQNLQFFQFEQLQLLVVRPTLSALSGRL